MRAHRLLTTGLAALGMLAGGLVFSGAPALAATGYGFTGVFGSGTSTPANPEPLSSPAGVAVDNVAGPSEGDVYVVDAGHNRVERFSSTGSYLGQFNGSGMFEVEGKVEEHKPAPPAPISSPASLPEHGTLYNIAVDSDPSSPSEGDVYVVDPGDNAVDKFSATGEYLFQLTGFKSAVFGVAVDSSGDVWVAEEGGGVQEFSGAVENKPVTSLIPEFGRRPGIAVDSEGNLYLIRGSGFVAKFNKEGATLDGRVIADPSLNAGSIGLTVDQSTNDLFYIDEDGTSISEDGPFFGKEPEPLTVPLLEPGFGLAHLTSGSGVAVNSVTGTVYVADSSNNDVDIFMLGVGESPVVNSESASGVTSSAATLEAQVNPYSQATTYAFEYSTKEAGEYSKLRSPKSTVRARCRASATRARVST